MDDHFLRVNDGIEERVDVFSVKQDYFKDEDGPEVLIASAWVIKPCFLSSLMHTRTF